MAISRMPPSEKLSYVVTQRGREDSVLRRPRIAPCARIPTPSLVSKTPALSFCYAPFHVSVLLSLSLSLPFSLIHARHRLVNDITERHTNSPLPRVFGPSVASTTCDVITPTALSSSPPTLRHQQWRWLQARVRATKLSVASQDNDPATGVRAMAGRSALVGPRPQTHDLISKAPP